MQSRITARGTKRFTGQFLCPLCGASADQFGPFGENRRENAQCPTCGSLERHRFLWIALTRLFDIEKASLRLLHLAPEASLSRLLRRNPNIEYTTADLYNPRADVHFDITKRAPFDEGSFDAVLCSHVLEHVDDDRAALREIHRLIGNNGRAYLMVPIDSRLDVTIEDPLETDPDERRRRFGQSDHVRLYGRDFPDRLAAEGFSVRELNVPSLLTPEEARRFRCDRGSAGYLHVAQRLPRS